MKVPYGSLGVSAVWTGSRGRVECGKQTEMSIAKIRARIDELDDHIIALLALRQEQVKQAASHKCDAGAVRAPARRAEIMTRLAQKAVTHRLEPEVVTAVYTAMIDTFIELELRQLAACHESPAPSQPVD